MTAMQNFIMWFVSKLPDFFMSEPIIYIFGFVLLAFVIKLILKMSIR